MRDAGFLENLADRAVSALEIESFGGQLRMKNRAPISSLFGGPHQGLEDLAPDAARAHVREHRHSADLYLVAVGNETPASDCYAVENREHVECVRIIVVELDFLRNICSSMKTRRRIAWASRICSAFSIGTMRTLPATSMPSLVAPPHREEKRNRILW